MRTVSGPSVIAGLSLSLAACGQPVSERTPGTSADLILTNAKVYSLTWQDPDADGNPAADAPYADGSWTPDAEAIAVKDGLILALGSVDEMSRLADDATRVIDVHGATVVPGFIESHGHFPELGEIAERIDLAEVTTMDEMARRVAIRVEETPAGEWVAGAGWDEGAWADALPTKGPIDAVSPDHPVVLKGRRGFGTLVNQKALELAGITSDSVAPSGGEIVADEVGQPTGVFLNRAQRMITDAMPPATLEQNKRIVLTGLREIAAAGYVSGHHAGVYSDYMPAYEALAQEGSLPVRLEAMLAARPENLELMKTWIERGPTQDRTSRFQVRGVKAYYDGSLGSRGAKLIEEYSDMPGHSGVSGSQYGFPEDVVIDAIAAGFQVGVHAIGDAGNRDVLDFYERGRERKPRFAVPDASHRACADRPPRRLRSLRRAQPRGVDAALPRARGQPMGTGTGRPGAHQRRLCVAHPPQKRRQAHLQLRPQRHGLRHPLRVALRGDAQRQER